MRRVPTHRRCAALRLGTLIAIPFSGVFLAPDRWPRCPERHCSGHGGRHADADGQSGAVTGKILCPADLSGRAGRAGDDQGRSFQRRLARCHRHRRFAYTSDPRCAHGHQRHKGHADPVDQGARLSYGPAAEQPRPPAPGGNSPAEGSGDALRPAPPHRGSGTANRGAGRGCSLGADPIPHPARRLDRFGARRSRKARTPSESRGW
jgi:hypothetical protein